MIYKCLSSSKIPCSYTKLAKAILAQILDEYKSMDEWVSAAAYLCQVFMICLCGILWILHLATPEQQ